MNKFFWKEIEYIKKNIDNNDWFEHTSKEDFTIENFCIKKINGGQIEVKFKNGLEEWQEILVTRNNNQYGLYVNGKLINPKHGILFRFWQKIKFIFGRLRK